MARDLITVERVGSPTAAQFETALTAALASLLSSLIGAFEVVVTDKLPASTRLLKATIDTDAGGTVITHPYLAKVFEAYDDVTLMVTVEAFMAANPSYWFSPIIYRYSDQLPGVGTRSLIFLLYNTSAADGAANWDPGYIASGGGGGSPTGPAGGDLSGAYPDPTLAETTHGERITNALAALAGNEVWSGAVAGIGAGSVDLLLQKGTTQYRTTINFNQGDGTTPEWAEDGVVIYPAVGGTFDVVITLLVVGPLLTVLVTPATAGWNARAFGQVLTPAP